MSKSNRMKDTADRLQDPPLNLSDIIDAETLQTMIEDFYQFTRIGGAILDLSGNILASVGWQEICSKFHRIHPETRKKCIESDTQLTIDLEPGKFKSYRCRNHMWDMVTPVIVENRQVGTLFIGQFFLKEDPPDTEFFRKAAQQYGFDENEYLSALEKVPRWGRETIEKAKTFYAGFAGLISSLAQSRSQLSEIIAQKDALLEDLQKSEEKYRLIADHMANVISVVDMNLRFTYVSPSIYRVRGYTAEEAMEQTLDQIMTPESLRIIYEVFDEEMRLEASGTADPNRSRVLELQEYKKDGSVVWLENTFSFIRDAEGKPESILALTRDVSERKRVEMALRSSKEKFRKVFMTNPDPVAITRCSDGMMVMANQEFYNVTGYTEEDLIAKTALDINIWENPRDREMVIEKVKTEGSVKNFESRFRLKNGEIIDGLMSLSIIDLDGAPHFFNITKDITDRKLLEAKLSQAQKMESVGRLAGGVAHDFNNMLGVIIGHAEMAIDQANQADPIYEDLLEIQKAARRSADLTRQLLAFARRQAINPVVLDINDTISGMLKMLRRIIGEGIELAWKPGVNLWPVKIDPAQVDQILANLLVNAKDAIAGVGRVIIETTNISFDQIHCKSHAGLVPGDYAMIAVSDTGSGMDRGIIEHIFEPFFTTKEVGKGTGLGLSTVYGVVKQNNGFIYVYSESGKGTTAKIYLPRADGQTAAQTEKPEENHLNGTETILLVEDEGSILKLTVNILKKYGYTVLATQKPSEAIVIAERHTSPIHLLITDVVMPEMNGRELIAAILPLQQGIRHLFMSGYTAEAIAQHGVLNKGVNFIQKPFSVKAFAKKVREILEKRS